MRTKINRSPFIGFLPFLFYYGWYIARHRWHMLYGDETRYINFASNMLHGFYSPPAPHINLWSGPGYSILLMPFVYFHSPIMYMALFNAVLYYLSVVLLYKTLCYFADYKLALLAAIIWAVYPNMISLALSIYTEVLTSLVISAFVYCLASFYIKRAKAYLIACGLLLGYLALIKIIFGYVLLFCLFVCLVLLLIKRAKNYYKSSVYILLIALAFTMPYLIYTYQLTGKIFYWGNSGGMSLYWMATPYENEYGDWKPFNLSNTQFPLPIASAEGDTILKRNHSKEYAFILSHNELEQDALFKKMALTNIRKNPKKFARNYFYNISRLLFNFPYSYTYQDAGIISNIITGSLILWTSIVAAIFSILSWRRMKYPIKFSLLITLVYLLLTGALSAYPRQLDVVVPVLIFWVAIVAYNLSNSLKSIKKQTVK